MSKPGSIAPHGGQKYFPHVDGIRSVAILPVVLYHLVARFCPGGFAGVDVFFVISGYLITAGIIADLQAGQYSITDFYSRRIRRILPAYMAVIAFVLFTVPLFYSVLNSWTVARTALCSLAYSANIYFNVTGSYFELGVRENPLLHLWSLGVEEQFYLVIPLCLWLLWRIRKDFFLVNLVLLFAASLVTSVWTLRTGHAQFAFYELPSRAWELLAGAILSQLVPVKPATAPGGLPKDWPAWLGTGLILFTYVTYSDNTPFPGLYALPAVLGAVLLIRYGATGISGRILACRPMVFIGKLSYSLYLWHWTIFTMCRSAYSTKQAVAAVVATLVVTYLSWRFVETPIRQFKGFRPRHAFTLLIAGSLILAGTALAILNATNHNGAAIRQLHGIDTWAVNEPNTLHYEDLVANRNRVLIKIGDQSGKADFVLWGDSHGLALLPGMDTIAAERGQTGYYINFRQGFGTDHGNPAHDLGESQEPVYRWLATRPDIQTVFIINRWYVSLWNGSKIDYQKVYNVCDRLHRLGKHVYFIQSVPQASLVGCRLQSWGIHVPEHMLAISQQAYNATRAESGEDRLTDQLTRDGLATILPANNAFLSGDHYLAGTSAQCYYNDNNHLNPIGSMVAMHYLGTILWPTNTAPARDKAGLVAPPPEPR